MHRAVVIHPPVEAAGDHIDYPWLTGAAPLGLATVLRQRGVFVHLLDAVALPGAGAFGRRDGSTLYGVPYPGLVERLADADFDSAVLHVTPFLVEAGRSEGFAYLVRTLRRLRPGSRLVAAELYAGGMHRSAPGPEAFRAWYPELDALVTLEGEETVPDLLLRERLDRFAFEGTRASRETLDALCPPDLSLVEWDGLRSFLGRVARTPKASDYGLTERSFPIFFSRGCPFSCSFCTNPYQDYRAVSLDRCVAAMDALSPHVERLVVLDDAANVRRDFGPLLQAAADRGLRLEFPNGLRADLLSRDLVDALSRVTDRITVSAESASARVMKDVVGKSVDISHVERVASWCHEARLPLGIHWMVGLPGETADELATTLSAARRLLDDFRAAPLIQYATPLPGTRLPRKQGSAGQQAAGGSVEGSGVDRREPQPPRLPRKQGSAGQQAAGGSVEGSGVDRREPQPPRLPRKQSSLLPQQEESVGDRMQHAPTWVPAGVDRGKMALAVDLVRRRASNASTAKVIINVTYKCNNHCSFCAVGNRLQEHLPLEHIRSVLDRYREQGVRQLDIDGGEPTLREDLFDIIRYAVERGYTPINVTTNGRRLAYLDFARQIVGSGITSLLISLHGHTAEIHEAVTGAAGSFAESMAGIRNVVALAPAGLDFGINTTLAESNYRSLPLLVARLFDTGVRKVNFQFLTPFGRAQAGLVPRPEDAAAVVAGILSEWKDRMALQVVNLPCCYLPGFESFVGVDLGKLSRNMVFVTKEEVNLHNYLAGTRQHDATCAECILRVACDGRYDFSKVMS